MKMHSNRGFTIPEILVSVAILAAITAIFYASYKSIYRSLANQTTQNEIDKLNTAIDEYKIHFYANNYNGLIEWNSLEEALSALNSLIPNTNRTIIKRPIDQGVINKYYTTHTEGNSKKQLFWDKRLQIFSLKPI